MRKSPHLPINRLTDAEGRVKKEFGEISKGWTKLKEHWKDAVRDDFERQQLQSLGPSLSRFCASLHELVEELYAAERELKEEAISDE